MRIFSPLNSELAPGLQEIEVSSTFQIPSMQLIGLPAPEVGEARERVRAAIEAAGLEFPKRRLVVNLSPASVRKRGTGIDLAIALGVLASNERDPLAGEDTVAWGELGLEGSIKPAGQPTRTLVAAWRAGVARLLLSPEDLAFVEARIELVARCENLSSPPPRLIGVRTLAEAWDRLRGVAELENPPAPRIVPFPRARAVTGHHLMPLGLTLQRAIGAAAAGAHHLLLLGPQGVGKSHALEWLASIQPPAGVEQKLARLLAAELNPGAMPATELSDEPPPCRRVSAHARPAALVGSAFAGHVRPGEYSLAHGGLLIADEFPEWARDARESLREPLESGRVILNRAGASVELPARFTLAASGNLCPCGGWPPELPRPEAEQGAPVSALCGCPAAARARYLERLSGPVLDRVDLTILVSMPAIRKAAESRFELIREKTALVHEHSRLLWGKPAGWLEGWELEKLCGEHPRWRDHLEAVDCTSLRARHKILRTALTLALWDDREEPEAGQFWEASFYRPERAGIMRRAAS
jgi:magnesium chelatase family protein